MDKRLIVAAALSIAILVGWEVVWNKIDPPPPPAPVERTADPLVGDEGATGPRGTTGPRDSEPVAPDDDDELSADETATESVGLESFVIDNGLFQVALTNDGARAESWKLLDYTHDNGDSLELLPQFDQGSSSMLAIELDDAELARTFNEARYEVERVGISSPRGERITFRWADGRGLRANKVLEIYERSYLIDVKLDVSDRGRRLPARIALGPGFGAQEPSRTTYYYDNQILSNTGGEVTRLKPKKAVDGPGEATTSYIWAGLEDQYFTALVLPAPGEATKLSWRPVERKRIKVSVDDDDPELAPEPLVAVGVPSSGARLYVGPKKFTLLRELGSELEKSVWFATNGFLAWIARFIFLCLIWIHDHTIPNYGMAIILSTFLLRLILFPVNQYSMVAMKKSQMQMQRLQPKIKTIRAKYKKAKDAESRNKMNQEMMELYRKEGVNPMGGVTGCLPLLAQFPILIGFYNMLTVAIELRGAPFFGWISDLSRTDPWFVIPLAMGATMMLQQKMAMTKVKDPVQAQQQRFMMIMPVVFTVICINMPAGMVLYWFVNNVLGIGQQWLVNRQTARLEAAAQKA